MQKEIRKQIRQSLRNRRRSLTKLEQRRAAAALCKQLKGHLFFYRAKSLTLYIASDGEIDTQPIIDLCWKLKKEVYLPVLDPIHENRLWFSHFDKSTKMHRNRFGILEPKLKRSAKQPWALDLVLMPLVGFDSDGGRIGMGGGFYDRTFRFKTGKRFGKRPRLFGLAHDFQRVEDLPLEPWDVRLDGVVTDQATYLASC